MRSRKTKPSKAALTRKRNAARRRANRRQDPFGRLHEDGASTAENIRRRLQWLASVWQIPAGDIPKIKRSPTQELVDFCDKYDVSLDWLYMGEPRHLQRMMWQRAERARGRPTLTERIMATTW